MFYYLVNLSGRNTEFCHHVFLPLDGWFLIVLLGPGPFKNVTNTTAYHDYSCETQPGRCDDILGLIHLTQNHII